MNPALDSNMDAIRAKLLKALDEKRNSLHEHEIYEILGLAGFRVPRTRFVAREKEIDALDTADMSGGEVVCKLISPGMPHRTEFGGIKFIPNNPKELAASFREFARIAAIARVPFSGMMIAEKVPGRDSIPFQLLLSLRQDPSFGPVVFCGLGGVGTEVYKKSLTREKGLLIRSASEIGDVEGTERALDATFFYPVIAGKTRVSKKPIVDTAKLRAALAAFAKLGEAFSPLAADSPVTIEEIEVNPLQITDDGELVPLDALMRISGAKHDLAGASASGHPQAARAEERPRHRRLGEQDEHGSHHSPEPHQGRRRSEGANLSPPSRRRRDRRLPGVQIDRRAPGEGRHDRLHDSRRRYGRGPPRRAHRGREDGVDHPHLGRVRRDRAGPGARSSPPRFHPEGEEPPGRRSRRERAELHGNRFEAGRLQHLLSPRIQAALPGNVRRAVRDRQPERRIPRHPHQQPRPRAQSEIHDHLRQPGRRHGDRLPSRAQGRSRYRPLRALSRGAQAL